MSENNMGVIERVAKESGPILIIVFGLTGTLYGVLQNSIEGNATQIQGLQDRVYELRANSITTEQLDKTEERINKTVEYRFDVLQAQIKEQSRQISSIAESQSQMSQEFKEGFGNIAGILNNQYKEDNTKP